MKKKFLALFLMLCIIGTSFISIDASSSNQLKKKLNDVNQQIKDMRSEIKTLKKQQQDYAAQVETLSAQVALTSLEIDKAQTQLEDVQEKLVVTQKDLETAKQNVEDHRNLFDKRVRVMYMEGSMGYLDVILNANSFSDFISRIDMVNKIIDNDTEILDEMKTYQAQVTAKKKQLEEQKADVVSLKTTLVQKNNSLQSEIAAKNQKIEEAKADVKKAEAMEDRMEAQAKAISSEIYALQSKTAVYVGNSNKRMQDPLPGARVTSPFGTRFHPVLKKYKTHSGVDLGAGKGTPIYAAEAGTVIVAGVSSGYGNYIVIDHGGGISTLYGHCSKLLVSKGQKVTRGQNIALVGSTGMSTGPHLHFEVRINGNYVNPIPYIR